MNKLLPYIAKPLFAMFALTVAAGVLYFSWNALGLIFPDDLAGQLLGIALFDIAMAVWFAVFLTNCEATMQYVWSVLGFLIGLGGTIVLVSMEIGTSSGMLDPATLAKPLSYTFIGVLLGHLLLSYAFHASAPEQAAQISTGIEIAKVKDEAQKQVEKKMGEKLNDLADVISDDLLRGVLRSLRITVTGEPRQDVKPYAIIDVPKEEGAAAAPGFLSRWFAWADRGEKKQNMNAQSAAGPFPVVTPKPSPAPLDAGSAGVADEEPKS